MSLLMLREKVSSTVQMSPQSIASNRNQASRGYQQPGEFKVIVGMQCRYIYRNKHGKPQCTNERINGTTWCNKHYDKMTRKHSPVLSTSDPVPILPSGNPRISPPPGFIPNPVLPSGNPMISPPPGFIPKPVLPLGNPRASPPPPPETTGVRSIQQRENTPNPSIGFLYIIDQPDMLINHVKMGCIAYSFDLTERDRTSHPGNQSYTFIVFDPIASEKYLFEIASSHHLINKIFRITTSDAIQYCVRTVFWDMNHHFGTNLTIPIPGDILC